MDRELIENVKFALCSSINGDPGNCEKKWCDGCSFVMPRLEEAVIHAIPIIAQEIKNMKLPGAIGGYKTVDDMMRSPDYKYCGFGDICYEVQQDMLKAILDLLGVSDGL